MSLGWNQLPRPPPGDCSEVRGREGGQKGQWGQELASIFPGSGVGPASCFRALEVTGRRGELRPTPPPTSWQITQCELGSGPARGQKEAGRRQESLRMRAREEGKSAETEDPSSHQGTEHGGTACQRQPMLPEDCGYGLWALGP